MVQALLSGAIDGTLPNVSEARSQVEDGSFRALAVMAEKRLADQRKKEALDFTRAKAALERAIQRLKLAETR